MSKLSESLITISLASGVAAAIATTSYVGAKAYFADEADNQRISYAKQVNQIAEHQLQKSENGVLEFLLNTIVIKVKWCEADDAEFKDRNDNYEFNNKKAHIWGALQEIAISYEPDQSVNDAYRQRINAAIKLAEEHRVYHERKRDEK